MEIAGRERPSRKGGLSPIKRTSASIGCIAISGRAYGASCDLSSIPLEKTKIEIIPHKIISSDSKSKVMGVYETAIILGGNGDHDIIPGSIAEQERDGSREISNVNGEVCGTINANLTIDIRGTQCVTCGHSLSLRKIMPGSFAVVRNSSQIVDTIEGRLNEDQPPGEGRSCLNTKLLSD